MKVKYNIGPLKCVSASRKLESGKAKLVIKACNTNYGFYLRDGDEDIFLSSADSKYLSSEVSEGFTGAMIGLFSVGDNTARFTDFSIQYI